jgi:RHS repeat-associated protein
VAVFAKYHNQTGKAWFDDITVGATGTTNALMSEYNIVPNGSFESDLDGNGKADFWQEVIQSGTTANVRWEEEAYIGDSSVSIANPGGAALYRNTHSEPIRPGNGQCHDQSGTWQRKSRRQLYFDSFGNPLTATGTATTGDGKLLRTENPFRYASYVYDEETGFYYLSSRYYEPRTGRFITRDTIADSNLYLYTDNNPVNFIDQDGKFPLPLLIMAVRIGWTAYHAHAVYKSIKNDPSTKNILLNMMPGGKFSKMGAKKVLALMKKKGGGKGNNKIFWGSWSDYK